MASWMKALREEREKFHMYVFVLNDEPTFFSLFIVTFSLCLESSHISV
jgi:hypothetical protein